MSLNSRITTAGRVTLAVTTVLVAGVVALSIVAFVGVRSRLSADMDRTLLRESEAYAAAIGPDTGRKDADVVAASRAYLAARTGAGSETRPILLVRFASGKVLSNSSVPLETASGNAELLDPARATRSFSTLSVGSTEYRVAVVPVTAPSGKAIAVFEAGLSTAPSQQVAGQLGWTLFAAGMAVVLLGAVAAALIAQASLGPLRRAAHTAAGIGTDSLGQRIDRPIPNDEVGQMVDALNGMLDRLEAAFSEQRRFVADASHELRTPLAVIRGHLELVQRGDLSEEDRSDSMTLIFDELDRVERLVNDLLKLARLEAGPARAYQPLELCTLGSEAVARGKALCGCSVFADCPGTVWAYGDPDALTQALLNLVRNAADHTPSTGEIVVSVRPEGTEAVIRVTDSGSGLRAEDLPHLFDRFYRASGPRSTHSGGSGLGLAITRRLVELHGGSVAAANREDGRGAVFTIRLPRIEEPDTEE